MLSIAICDDDIQTTGKMESIIQKMAKQNLVNIETEVFWDGKSLVDAIINKNNFDLIYLDIEMDKEDGISAAKKIREYDKNVLIIYVTSHENHMKESFSVHPFQFLVKPVNEKLMETCFKAAIDDINDADFYFRYSYKRVNYKVPVRDILYFESNRRKILIVTQKDIYELYGKLNEIESSLESCKISFLRVHQSFLVNYKHVDGLAYNFVIMDNGKKISISEDRRKVIVRWRIHFMLLNKVVLEGTDILLVIFAIYLFSCYFDIFFTRRKKRILAGIGYMVFVIWQFVLSSVSILPVYINISITIIVTFISVMFIYEGGKWNKCIFTLAFNAIWMMIETLSGYVLSIYCMQFINFQIYEILGSVISKLLFLILIFSLKRVFSSNGITEFSAKYSVMLILIPIGSIYVMNEIFLFSYKINSNRAYFHSAVAAIILLCLNVLIFYIYVKLTDDLQLRRMTSVYEQQLELCERHQQEREISTLQLRDAKHNMKNNLVSILAYAEQEKYEKIIEFVNEIMEESGMALSAISNSGNIVIDSLLGYWHLVAKRKGIDFLVNVSIPMKMSFKGADICLILGNLLENAVEAAEKVRENKYIKIKMKYDKSNLLIFLINSYQGQLIKMKDKSLKSTKSDVGNHGVGLPSVYRAVAKYHGTVTIDDSIPEQFGIRVVLYGSEE